MEVRQEDPVERPLEVALLPTSIRYHDTGTLAHPSVRTAPLSHTPQPRVTTQSHARVFCVTLNRKKKV